ncbi:uncharacterized protein B0I36DRAFT_310220 [Microdochium trichocladiopsis]|uniref:Uncharacterized protein n=1 Tax=Microdochium trichocladiopsis TaxID=1682393 RepID=A0A9P8YEC5_9PEZI|nr:uncharacterized protein B0I36DRAFT_310220 [Microdochium trichocladiopsis]KAH7040232.1 hypothetical protein B0I36DRAFT_310220 [Microdochium trichocladiopsis]
MGFPSGTGPRLPLLHIVDSSSTRHTRPDQTHLGARLRVHRFAVFQACQPSACPSSPPRSLDWTVPTALDRVSSAGGFPRSSLLLRLSAPFRLGPRRASSAGSRSSGPRLVPDPFAHPSLCGAPQASSAPVIVFLPSRDLLRIRLYLAGP